MMLRILLSMLDNSIMFEYNNFIISESMNPLSFAEQLSFSTTRIETSDPNGNDYSGIFFFFRSKLDENKYIDMIVTNTCC